MKSILKSPKGYRHAGARVPHNVDEKTRRGNNLNRHTSKAGCMLIKVNDAGAAPISPAQLSRCKHNTCPRFIGKHIKTNKVVMHVSDEFEKDIIRHVGFVGR